MLLHMSCMVLLSGADHIPFHANVHFQGFKTVSMANSSPFWSSANVISYHMYHLLLLHVVSLKLKKSLNIESEST